jgi:CRP-like cAMP-binding protein
VLADQLRRTNVLVLDAYYATAEKRVLRRLRDVAVLYADGVVRLTQEDLASLAGTSRATVNKVLREEQRRGTVELTRGCCAVLDVDALDRRAR